MVHADEAPTAVVPDMGLYTNRIFIWLAAYRSGGFAQCARKGDGPPQAPRCQKDPLGLRHRDHEKSPVGEAPIRAVDARPHPHPDPAIVQSFFQHPETCHDGSL